MRIEKHNLDGTGIQNCEVYDMPSLSPHDYWLSVTDVPCPVPGCNQTIVWYEAGWVPGYRVCMARIESNGFDYFDSQTLNHRFLARGNAARPVLVRVPYQ